MEKNYEKLVDAIESLLSEGIKLNGDVAHCLDSIGGINTPRALERMLSRPLDHETETLCELIFFPDESQQIRLEPVIQTTAFNEEDIDRIIDRLWRDIRPIPIQFPENGGVCRAAIPYVAIGQFVRRLNISRSIDSRISEAIKAGCDPGLSLRLRVMLRNARFCFSENIVGFIGDLLSSIETAAPDFPVLFALACDTLEPIGPENDIFTALMAKRRQCAEMIRQSGNSDLQLTAQPVEALIMRGARVFAGDREEMRQLIGRIDRIGLAVYGRTEPPDYLHESEKQIDLGVYKRNWDDFEKVIKILS